MTSRGASSGAAWTGMTYDSAGRLTAATVSGKVLIYQYDARGNRLAGGEAATTYTVNTLNQPTARQIASAQRGYGVYGRVAAGAQVRVFHPGSGPEGEQVAVDAQTGAYSGWWPAGSATPPRQSCLRL